jgi:hypothetical protein
MIIGHTNKKCFSTCLVRETENDIIAKTNFITFSYITEVLKVKCINAVLLRHTGTKGRRNYRSYSFLTSAVDVLGGQGHAPAALYTRQGTPSIH